jgi:asparagine synthetase B (glutamine-hydrolysing)
MSAGNVAWVAEFSAIEGDSGRRHLRLTNNPPSWRPQFAEGAAERVIFDGTVHNREELKQRLSIGKAEFLNDADLVLAAYAEWGEDAWHRIKGYFAILLWDQNRDRLLSVRDPLGVWPLFYAETAGKLILSPCIQTLRSHPDVLSDLNRPALVDYLARRCVNRDETHFEQIRRVLPGHVLRASPNGSTELRYWDPVPASGEIDWISDAEVQEQFDALLEQAVTRAQEGSPAGVFLSGGLDSAIIATVAADVYLQNGTPPPQLFSFAFPDPYSEQSVQRGVATGLGLAQQLLTFDEAIPSGSVLTSGIELSANLPAPLSNTWAPIYLRLSLEAVRRGCRMMMTGEGGDEWLGVPPHLVADLLRAGNIRGLYRLWRANVNYYPDVRWASPASLVVRYGLGPLLQERWRASRVAVWLKRRRTGQRQVTTAAGTAPWIAPEPWIAPDPVLRNAVSTRLLARCGRGDDARIESAYVMNLRRQLSAAQPLLRAEEYFVLGRRAGIPIRDPFYDPDLIEFMVRVHPLTRQRNGVSKALIRERLSRRFPDLGFERQQKKPIDIQSVTRAETEQALKILGRDWVLDELGVIDSRQMLRTIDDLTGVKGWRVWDLLNLEAWVRANH